MYSINTLHLDLIRLFGVESLTDSLPDSIVRIISFSILLSIAYFFLWLIKRAFTSSPLSSRTREVIFTGPMGAGKTVLFYRLQTGKIRTTFPSMKESCKQFTLFNTTIYMPVVEAMFVDFPGHGSQRHKLPKYLASSSLIVFCIDGCDSSTILVAAQNLYDILVHKNVHRKRTPVFIACMKSDSATFRGVDTIITELQKEIGAIRDARHEMIQDLTSSSEPNFSLGTEGVDFVFSQCPSMVCAGAISAISGQFEALIAAIQKA